MKRAPLYTLTAVLIVVTTIGVDCPGGGVWQPLMDHFFGKFERERDDDIPYQPNIQVNQNPLLLNLTFNGNSGGTVIDDKTLWYNDGYVQVGNPGDMTIWAVQISQRKIIQETGEVIETTPVAGVTVTVRFVQGDKTQIMTGTTGSDGYAAFTFPQSAQLTELFLVNIQGETPWNSVDAAAHGVDPVLTSAGLGT